MSFSPLTYWSIALIITLTSITAAFKQNQTYGWSLTFLFLVSFRYVRLLVNIVAYLRLRPVPLSSSPQFGPKDVTVIVPTKFSHPEEHIRCIQNILACNPLEIIVVTAAPKFADVSKHLSDANILPHVTLISAPHFDKKLQMINALTHAVRGDVCCFADDDVQWPSAAFLPTMLACFENPRVGACGPSQRVRRDGTTFFGYLPSLCNFIGIGYLERRNWNNVSNTIDGGISTLSGRTSLFLSSIIQNQHFYSSLLAPNVGASDDKALTRYVFSQGWNIAMQYHPDALIETTLENDYLGLSNQCVRWARGHWRGNFNVMTTATYWYKQHTWSLYAIYFAQFQTPAFVYDMLMTIALRQSISGSSNQSTIFFAWLCWIYFAKTVKLIPHFCRHPQDMIYIPHMITFSYLHGFVNLYALFTCGNDAWGARKNEKPNPAH